MKEFLLSFVIGLAIFSGSLWALFTLVFIGSFIFAFVWPWPLAVIGWSGVVVLAVIVLVGIGSEARENSRRF